MPRSGGGVYSLPAGSIVTDGVDDILAAQHNDPLNDLALDMNTARPIVAGGTGATTAPDALVNLGLTATAAELNVLDGMTASTAELNVLDGIPGTLTATELGYVGGVTSAIQGQLDAKQAGDADLTAIAALASTGIAVRTASDTWAQRQVVSADGSATITNPAGVAGNIDVSVNAVGVGQTWQNVIGSRADATSYQNTTGKAIMVSVTMDNTGGGTASGTFEVSVNNSTWVVVAHLLTDSGSEESISIIVPNDHYYKTVFARPIVLWAELR